MINVLVVGELCEDNFIYGECKRLSPEAPVPVMNPIFTVQNPGMSGNVVENLKALDENLNIEHWYQTERVFKTRFVDKKTNHMFLRLDDGETFISPMTHSQERLTNIKDFDIVIVSDYNKGFLDEEWLKYLGRFANLSILDSKRILSKEVVESFTFVKLNEKEFHNNPNIHECNNIITTLGEKGARYNGITYESPKPQETIDVSGAGDTFTASFILAYFKTRDIEESIIYANNKSSIVVSKRGVATP